MATAVCDNCRYLIHWRARRGNRLKDHSCPACGGKLRSKKDDAHDNSMGWTPILEGAAKYKALTPELRNNGQAGQP